MMDDFLRQCVDNRVFRAFYTLPPLKNNDDSYVQENTTTSNISVSPEEIMKHFIYYKYDFGGQKSIHEIFVCIYVVDVTYIVHCAAQSLHKITYAETS